MLEFGKLMKIVDAPTEATWSAALFDVARTLGFDSVLFGAVASKHVKLESSFIHSNYAPDWREHYDALKLYNIDPTVNHCLNSSLPIVWEPATFVSQQQGGLYEEASSFGIRSGVTFPIHGAHGELGLISFAGDQLPGEQFTEQMAQSMADLSLLRDYAFESSLKFLKARTPAEPVPHLTKRELEVIKWVMAGKSSWEISRITDCAEATINFHIANIRQKFNVNTRQQALVKAIALGIISPEDPHR
ncbi:MAG: LuxR family transcriptional regulator [Pseudomonadota bacterium]|nr:LuxR family transcriptional regulator [Pseudomonadota bacterium]